MRVHFFKIVLFLFITHSSAHSDDIEECHVMMHSLNYSMISGYPVDKNVLDWLRKERTVSLHIDSPQKSHATSLAYYLNVIRNGPALEPLQIRDMSSQLWYALKTKTKIGNLLTQWLSHIRRSSFKMNVYKYGISSRSKHN